MNQNVSSGGNFLSEVSEIMTCEQGECKGELNANTAEDTAIVSDELYCKNMECMKPLNKKESN